MKKKVEKKKKKTKVLFLKILLNLIILINSIKYMKKDENTGIPVKMKYMPQLVFRIFGSNLSGKFSL